MEGSRPRDFHPHSRIVALLERDLSKKLAAEEAAVATPRIRDILESRFGANSLPFIRAPIRGNERRATMVTGHFTNRLLGGVDRVRSSWGWFLGLGILLIVAGVICIAGDVIATFVTVVAFGWFLLFSGIVSLVQVFRVHAWHGVFPHLLSGLLKVFTGYVMVRYPGAGALGLTLVLASFFIVGGAFRTVGASIMRLPQWGWAVFSGIISLALGFMLLAQLPASSIWFIGFAIGVDMILEGVSMVGLAIALRSAPQPVVYRDRAA